MPDFIIAYHGGDKPASKEDGAQHMEKWKAWLGGLGDAVVNPGTPLGQSKLVTSSGVTDAEGAEALTGYTVVSAGDLDAAVEMAKACPFLDVNGTLEVAEMKQM